jgi:hypothetical protein
MKKTASFVFAALLGIACGSAPDDGRTPREPIPAPSVAHPDMKKLCSGDLCDCCAAYGLGCCTSPNPPYDTYCGSGGGCL